MSKNTELLGAVVIIVILAGMVLANFIRHLRWEERRFMWHVRIAIHCVLFCAALAGIAYVLTQMHHS